MVLKKAVTVLLRNPIDQGPLILSITEQLYVIQFCAWFLKTLPETLSFFNPRHHSSGPASCHTVCTVLCRSWGWSPLALSWLLSRMTEYIRSHFCSFFLLASDLIRFWLKKKCKLCDFNSLQYSEICLILQLWIYFSILIFILCSLKKKMMFLLQGRCLSSKTVKISKNF